MQYFDDMCSKFGFNDGDSEPPGSLAYRAVYVRALNALLAMKDSTVRVCAWNRPGMHNGCIIAHVTKGLFETMTPEQVRDGEHHREGILAKDGWLDPDNFDDIDDAYREALEMTGELDLDEYVHVSVQIYEPELTELLAQVAAEGANWHKP